MNRRHGIKLAVCALVLVGNGASAISPEDKCEADKNKIAGKYAFCRQKAEAKAIKKGEFADYSKCETKLLDKWAKAEQKAIAKGTACLDSVAGTAIQAFVTEHADEVAAALDMGSLPSGATFPATGQTTPYGTGSDGEIQAGAVLSYTDNLDGTITDNNTGLMWEKKNDSPGVHRLNNGYTWSSGTDDMDGTITSTFLALLNGDSSGCVLAGNPDPCCTGLGTGTCAPFAGYTDWRIPNIRELRSIVDYEVPNPIPSIDPAFYQSATCGGCTDVALASCSCTHASNHWSATTVAHSPGSAWVAGYANGVVIGSKTDFRVVRAVRGGL